MNNIGELFESMYYGDDTKFFTFVERVFLKEKKYNDNIEKYIKEYLKWFDKLTEDKKSKLINSFNKNK